MSSPADPMTHLSLPEVEEKSLRHPHTLQTMIRINHLLENYLSTDELNDRLTDLPLQFKNPQPRPWEPIDWHAIAPSQIVGVDLNVFLSVIVGAMEVEAPIRGYATVSFHYLEKIHPQMARFVGGTFTEQGKLQEPGLWEKEERQHTPALGKIYEQLTGEKLKIQPSGVKRYVPSDRPREDLYAHGLHRIATEYGATSLYLWLMAHSTGELQQVLGELVRDEVNHMTKFWGFGVWAYPEPLFTRFKAAMNQWMNRPKSDRREDTEETPANASVLNSVTELLETFGRVMGLVSWNAWPLRTKLELMFTFTRVLLQMRRWIRSLEPYFLEELFGAPPSLEV